MLASLAIIVRLVLGFVILSLGMCLGIIAENRSETSDRKAGVILLLAISAIIIVGVIH